MATQLDWNKLLNPQRRKDQAAGKAYERKVGEARTEHERDHDRILFSTPVRRLQDKTQVFPLERNDSVRTRLTHSHEVANMARSMGTTLAFVHGAELGLPPEAEPLRSVPALLEAVGLAHDLGNPPFGHQGESAIQSWMARNAAPRDAVAGSFGIFDGWAPTEEQRQDFLKFEGNAQAFRLLTRLQIVNDEFGLNMTYAFLAALMKYPVPSSRTAKGSQARKKFNFFQSEAEIAEEVWEHTGLGQGIRHPLTFVMEACDDIAYSVVDVEDAAKKGLINFNVLMAWLKHDAGDDPVTGDAVRWAEAQHADFRRKNLSPRELDDISMQMFRVNAIGKMVTAAVETFVRRKDEILSGAFDEELMASSTARTLWGSLKRFAKLHVYSHQRVLEVELEGHRTIHALMDVFWSAIVDRQDAGDLASKRPPLSGYVYSRISENYRRIAEAPTNRMPMRYRELQLITDMISGMSDSFALSLYEDLRRHHA
ncbi:MAG: dNTP triphosphohydrolase [Methylorubrum extorquens]|jgi:dGTPase|uniref:dGTP triphosphohydrolase n=1 Tax=Methylorubrum extorquens TaxID=408 RepID=UPI002FEDF5F3